MVNDIANKICLRLNETMEPGNGCVVTSIIVKTVNRQWSWAMVSSGCTPRGKVSESLDGSRYCVRVYHPVKFLLNSLNLIILSEDGESLNCVICRSFSIFFTR